MLSVRHYLICAKANTVGRTTAVNMAKISINNDDLDVRKTKHGVKSKAVRHHMRVQNVTVHIKIGGLGPSRCQIGQNSEKLESYWAAVGVGLRGAGTWNVEAVTPHAHWTHKHIIYTRYTRCAGLLGGQDALWRGPQTWPAGRCLL